MGVWRVVWPIAAGGCTAGMYFMSLRFQAAHRLPFELRLRQRSSLENDISDSSHVQAAHTIQIFGTFP